MTSHLKLSGKEKVLEIGTGSGYQAAILAKLAKEVHTVERIPELAESAKKMLKELGIKNVIVHSGDGSLGWPEAAPYDRIIVTAAAPAVPKELTDSLNRAAGWSFRLASAGARCWRNGNGRIPDWKNRTCCRWCSCHCWVKRAGRNKPRGIRELGKLNENPLPP